MSSSSLNEHGARVGCSVKAVSYSSTRMEYRILSRFFLLKLGKFDHHLAMKIDKQRKYEQMRALVSPDYFASDLNGRLSSG